MAAASCPRCGTPLSGASRFCQACGAPVLGAEETELGLPPLATTDLPRQTAAQQPSPTAYPVLAPRRGPSLMKIAAIAIGVLVAAALAVGGVVAFRGGDGDAPPTGQVTAPPTAPPTVPPATAEGTPLPTPDGTATPAATASPPPPTPRVVNGLSILDETWVGQVNEAGGLRIRSAPRVEAGNVVGSVAQGTRVNVEGKVLNGQEAEPGKGTEWLIVGPSQYIYAAPGYVERLR